ncbi:MAG: hypothetical protein KA184_14335 [Candidatus Hydrogenedentes bacterium]|nr:hypothetical protein [Candidatus Hydrogenedentota bacterium]
MQSAIDNEYTSLPGILAVLTELLLIPYVAWGIYNLRRRFRFHDDIPPIVEAITLALVGVFVAVEVQVLEYWFEKAAAYVIFAILGLFTSAVALYGHMAISLLSWLIVDFMMPGHRGNPDHPRMGPEEALEHQRDYEGALEGYLVLARIYPRDTEIPMRIVNNLLRLNREKEAPAWLQRALACCSTGEEAAPVVLRLCDVYERHLDDPRQARETLRSFLAQYPGVKEREALAERLGRIGTAIVTEHAAQLTRLAEAPLAPPPAPEPGPKPRRRTRLDVAPIQGPIAPSEPSSADKAEEPEPAKPALSIEAIRPPGPHPSGTKPTGKN